MRLHYKATSRFVCQLADTDYFVNELMAKYSLPETEMSEKFSMQMVAKTKEIGTNVLRNTSDERPKLELNQL